MSDNSDQQLARLFSAAREAQPDTSRHEWGFETRVMARIREDRSLVTSMFAWAWRLCPFFAALALAAGLWSRSTDARVRADSSLLVEVSQAGDEQALVGYLTGGGAQ
jgi:hypothetical protein